MRGISSFLTQDRHDDHYKVEEVPRLLEVVPSESEDLENTLRREDTDKDEIQVVQRCFPLLTHIVVIHCHGEHVQTDEQHDHHVELLVSHYLEHHGLWAELKTEKQENGGGNS